MTLTRQGCRKDRTSYNEPGHAHELTFSCYGGYQFLLSDRTHLWLVDALDRARQEWAFELWAYVIMPEHAHVLVMPQRSDYCIASFIKSVKQPVSRRAVNYLRQVAPDWLDKIKIDRGGRRVEHRFWQQGGGYDRNIYKEETAWSSVEYIHNNPVRRGLADATVDWEWSSASWYAGTTPVRLKMDNCPPGTTRVSTCNRGELRRNRR